MNISIYIEIRFIYIFKPNTIIGIKDIDSGQVIISCKAERSQVYIPPVPVIYYMCGIEKYPVNAIVIFWTISWIILRKAGKFQYGQ